MKAVIDIETGGFSKEKNGICEIGIIAVDENNIETGSLNVLINPYTRPLEFQEEPNQLVSYKDDAMAVHGITLDELLHCGLCLT